MSGTAIVFIFVVMNHREQKFIQRDGVAQAKD
jgi:hypothetical protein